MQLSQRQYRHARRAARHCRADGRIKHPCRHNDDHAGRHLNVNDLTAGASLDILAPNATPIECVPAIMDLDLLPDMGRMTGRLLSGAAHGYSPAPTAAVSALPRSIPSLLRQNSMASIHRPGLPTYCVASLIIRPPSCTSCCPGTGSYAKPEPLPPDNIA